MRKKKPYKILEERIKYYYIVLTFFKRGKIYTVGVSTSIVTGGVGHPDYGSYASFFEAKNAALHFIAKYHHSPPEQALLRKFRLMKDLDQPLLYYD
jgi:hypothetical protein